MYPKTRGQNHTGERCLNCVTFHHAKCHSVYNAINLDRSHHSVLQSVKLKGHRHTWITLYCYSWCFSTICLFKLAFASLVLQSWSKKLRNFNNMRVLHHRKYFGCQDRSNQPSNWTLLAVLSLIWGREKIRFLLHQIIHTHTHTHTHKTTTHTQKTLYIVQTRPGFLFIAAIDTV